MTADIIMFPKKNVRRTNVVQSVEDIQHQVKRNKLIYVGDILETLQREVLDALLKTGFVVDNQEAAKDCTLIIEAVRSTWFRKIGLQHDLQEYAEKMFEAKGKSVKFLGKKDIIDTGKPPEPPNIIA